MSISNGNDDKNYLEHMTFLSIFAYSYGEPGGFNRLFKTSLIQFTDTTIELDFDINIRKQLESPNITNNQLWLMNENYRCMFASAKEDTFYNDMYLESNFQNKLGGECYIFRRGLDRYIIFRGSDTPIDTGINLTIETTPLIIGEIVTDKNVRVHRGFLEQMCNYNFISQITKSIGLKTGMRLHIAGHSLGGASALIQGYYLHHYINKYNRPFEIENDLNSPTIYTDISITTVGGCVVGPSSWTTAFNGIFNEENLNPEDNIWNPNSKRCFFRLINETDIIPNLHTMIIDTIKIIPAAELILSRIDPPETINLLNLFARFFNNNTLDYQHVGHKTYIIKNNTLIEGNNNQLLFHTPTICDVINIANNHMIDYQKWLSTPLP